MSDYGDGYRQRMLARKLIEDALLATAVRRDPCPRCNVRRDIGCSHTAERLVAR